MAAKGVTRLQPILSGAPPHISLADFGPSAYTIAAQATGPRRALPSGNLSPCMLPGVITRAPHVLKKGNTDPPGWGFGLAAPGEHKSQLWQWLRTSTRRP